MESVSIEELNNENAKEYVGGVVFVSVLMLIGFLGNLHVLSVYTFFMKPSNHRIFIIVLGTLDFITCIVGMPFIIVDLRNPLTFTLSSACKVLRFINYFICTASALTLVVIATDRYRKICEPLRKQISNRVAKFLCCLVMLASLLLSWPAPVLYGIAIVQTEHNMTGNRCWTEDKTNYDNYQGYFNIILIVVVFVCFIVLVILYFLIGRVIVRHGGSRFHGDAKGRKKSNMTGIVSESATSTELYDKTTYSQSPVETKETSISASIDAQMNKSNERIATTTENKQNNFIRARRTTLMFFVITAVFFLSYMPHLTLQIINFIDEDFVLKMSFTGRVFYHTFLWTFFINNMSNCFIYGFFDRRFRDGIKQLYQRINCTRQ